MPVRGHWKTEKREKCACLNSEEQAILWLNKWQKIFCFSRKTFLTYLPWENNVLPACKLSRPGLSFFLSFIFMFLLQNLTWTWQQYHASKRTKQSFLSLIFHTNLPPWSFIATCTRQDKNVILWRGITTHDKRIVNPHAIKILFCYKGDNGFLQFSHLYFTFWVYSKDSSSFTHVFWSQWWILSFVRQITW